VEPNRASTPAAFDPSHDFLRTQSRTLSSLLSPKTVALIGATDRPGSVGHSILSNLAKGAFQGGIYPVNPKHGELLGLKAFPSIADLPLCPDLAVIATPAPTVPGLIGDCLAKGIPNAIVISAGFKELGPEGARLEEQISEKIKGKGLRILGPNCLGLMNPLIGLNATFASQSALPGSVAFLSQSGALGTAILEWSLETKVGFSAFISTGSMLDVSWGDLIDTLGSDPHTRSILIYMESIGDAPGFLSAAREVAFTKPIIVLKAGHTAAAAKAAVSHTGALAVSDDVLKAAFRRCGVLWVDQIEDLFYMAEVLAKQPRPKGPRLTILTNAGGPGVLATDTLVSGEGQMAELSAKTMEGLNAFLPAHWSHGNPVDVLGDAGPERFAKAVDLVFQDEASDGLLAILTPQAMTLPAQTVERLKSYGKTNPKPLLTCLMGGRDMRALRDTLQQAGIPSFAYPDTAARIFNHMWRYSSNLKSLYESPSPTGEVAAQDRNQAGEILAKASAEGRALLTEMESKQVLSLYGIPTVPTELAPTEKEAQAIAGKIGFPVVVKLHSLTLTHKSDVGGVQLNLKNGEEVARAFRTIEASVLAKAGPGHFQGVTVQPMVQGRGLELILGSSPDPQFGPVILFGMGGTLVEVLKDSALGLPPLTSTLALRLMEQTKVYQAFKGARGMPPVDLEKLAGLLVQFSRLVAEQPIIREIDINPLTAYGSQLTALDARVVLNPPPPSAWAKLAIRPYPYQYSKKLLMKNGSPVLLRPIRPEDESLMIQFHESLSETSVYMRYFQALKLDQRVAHNRLIRLCFIDYRREMALVVESKNAQGLVQILGVGRLSRSFRENEMEFSLLVGDPWQKQGLGFQILSQLVAVGRAEGVRRIVGFILPENAAMKSICGKLGFQLRYSNELKSMEAVLTLEGPPPTEKDPG